MHRIILLLFFALNLTGYGQQLKKVRHYNDSTGVTEIYQVLKSDPTIKQGFYKRVTAANDVTQTGFYKNGEKDSVWIQNDYISKHIFSKMYYSHGLVTGIAEYYDKEGELAQKYDYSNKRLVYNKSEIGLPAFAAADANPRDSVPPAYIGGDWAISTQLMRLIKYPENARINSKEGKVIVSFIIDEKGKAGNFAVTKGVDPELDAEALRACKLLPSYWIAGTILGHPVRTHFNLPVVFKLN